MKADELIEKIRDFIDKMKKMGPAPTVLVHNLPPAKLTDHQIVASLCGLKIVQNGGKTVGK